MKPRQYAYIYTIGCQMNTYDSEKISAVLGSMGYENTYDLDQADLVVCNTCSIRKKAQEKAFSFLGKVAGRKNNKKDVITIMAGCVAQQEGENVFKRIPNLDIVLGTQAFSQLKTHVNAVRSSKTRIVDTGEHEQIFELMPDFSTLEKDRASRFVTIMQGCDNYCTYCVVPYVRGRERSRKPENIIREIEILGDNGVKEVTLLGQNVNSYGKKEKVCSFPELLEKIRSIDTIKRIRFATSHPKDFSDDLIYAIRDNEKICRQVHLPVQSGSTRILKKMNRGYTSQDYMKRIEKLRKECPDIALSSDIIVGFPSETETDFQQTLDLVKDIEFDGLFAFSYSHRPNAPASKFSGEIDQKTKMARLNHLLEIQETFTWRKNQACVGRRESVLVEGRSLKQRKGNGQCIGDMHQMTGRTDSGKIVHFCAKDLSLGDILKINIEQAYPHSLWGSVCDEK
ncbi:MAG: tRNA (N6-isopentenyl adenosine(37)-C2)-methylthiotransferase MiaB [Thermodesulfobacteriota bacterium]|nr:tRNA (N6-isopentenyl adenosine(37)-C2)-methylthiotransferase MiaB [Thermodesulfobacteriota bacterium]